jgi:hypothetical protein
MLAALGKLIQTWPTTFVGADKSGRSRRHAVAHAWYVALHRLAVDIAREIHQVPEDPARLGAQGQTHAFSECAVN